MSDQQELVNALAAELSRERQLNFKQSSVLFHVLDSRPFVSTFAAAVAVVVVVDVVFRDVGQDLVPLNVVKSYETAANTPDRYHRTHAREHTEEEEMNGLLIGHGSSAICFIEQLNHRPFD